MLTFVAALPLPRMNGLPFAATAVVATPTVNASTTASPTLNVAILPTSTTFENILFAILCLPCLYRPGFPGFLDRSLRLPTGANHPHRYHTSPTPGNVG